MITNNRSTRRFIGKYIVKQKYIYITFSASSSFHDPIIKSAWSFLIPPAFIVEPFILVFIPPFVEPLTSDCSFRKVGEES